MVDYMELLRFGAAAKEFFFPKKNAVLIIDDDSNDILMMEIHLRHLGCQWDVAKTAEEALGLIRTKQYSTIFLDLRLPMMMGWHLLRKLTDESPNVHVVITPGHTMDPDNLPPSTYVGLIIKPASLQAIKKAIGH
jgi:CheY-like chemotaxis protein